MAFWRPLFAFLHPIQRRGRKLFRRSEAHFLGEKLRGVRGSPLAGDLSSVKGDGYLAVDSPENFARIRELEEQYCLLRGLTMKSSGLLGDGR